MKVKAVRALSLCLCLVLLLAGFVRTLLHPVTEIYYENRPANQIGTLTPGSFRSGEFQTSVESALADQTPLAIKMKKLYNILDAALSLPAARALAAEGRYAGYRDIAFFRDMLVLRPEMPEARAELYDSSRELIASWTAALPETDFYLYYIETDRDLNLETGEKTGIFEYLTREPFLPAGHARKLAVNSYAEYSRDFLATDHHWNAQGAYRAYLDICSMLGLVPLETDGIYTDHGHYLGTRAAGVEGLTPGDFSVVRYRYPPLTVSSGGVSHPDYGQQERFIAGELPGFSYGTVYGGDGGEIHFTCGTGRGNALILGDSYDNAILKALAAGFRNTWSVDLRAYGADTGRVFDLPAYVEENNIDLVLLIGGIDFYSANLLLS